MDIFVKYRVGVNTGYAKVKYNEREIKLNSIGRPDLEGIGNASHLMILSNDGTKRAAVSHAAKVCIVGEDRCVDFGSDEWHLKVVDDPHEIAECHFLMQQDIVFENRNKQKGRLIDVLNDISGADGIDVFSSDQKRIKTRIKGCFDMIEALDAQYKTTKEAFGHFVKYRDHGNTGFAEILNEQKDAVMVKYLTNDGTKDACLSLNLDGELRSGQDHVCVVGNTYTYNKEALGVDFELVENEEDLRLCHYMAHENAVLCDALNKQSKELWDASKKLASNCQQSEICRTLLRKVDTAISIASVTLEALQQTSSLEEQSFDEDVER